MGEAEDYGFGVPTELTATAADIDVPEVEDGVPQDIAVFAPSLAHRVGFREWWERAARRGASPATAVAFNLVTFSADVRSFLPDIRCPTLVVSRAESYAACTDTAGTWPSTSRARASPRSPEPTSCPGRASSTPWSTRWRSS